MLYLQAKVRHNSDGGRFEDLRSSIQNCMKDLFCYAPRREMETRMERIFADLNGFFGGLAATSFDSYGFNPAFGGT